jgi:hypothetical protein
MRFFRINIGLLTAAGDALLMAGMRLARYWPFSWRSISAIILGFLLAKWIWLLFAPAPVYTAALPERSAGTEAGQLFGIVVNTENTTQGVALPNVQLLGVFAASNYRTGFAILKIDNAQKGVAEGEEVSPGTRLLSVRTDHVLLERGGVQQRVNLENKYQGKSIGRPVTEPSQPAKSARSSKRDSTSQAIPQNPNPDEVKAAMEYARKQQQPGQY